MAQPVWNTLSGSLGSYPAGIAMTTTVSASPILPAANIRYILLSGVLPLGLTLSSDGIILGIPAPVKSNISTTFTLRAIDNLNSLRDRTFSLTIGGSISPKLTTPIGSLLITQDSIWTRLQLTYSNADPTNKVILQLKDGLLPPGLEIDSSGVIQGYPLPPTVNTTVSPVETISMETTAITNIITVYSTAGFTIGRPIVFTGTAFGDINVGTTYYIKSVNSSTTFTISTTQSGPVLLVSTDTGSMTVTLPAITVGQPTNRTYSFTIKLTSLLGDDIGSYSISVINQHTPNSQGGPGKLPNTRVPTVLNTRPLTLSLADSDPYYGYYIVPPVAPTQFANIGTIKSGDFFAFNIVGHDFDGNSLGYVYSNLPLGLVGNPSTGWITGTPTLGSTGISNYSFSASVYKEINPSLTSVNFGFSLTVSNEITGIITWVTPSNLGTIFNGSISTLSVLATSDVSLVYRVSSGSLPPNLELLPNGEIIGRVADQPTSVLLEKGDITNFAFTVEAYSLTYTVVISSREFSINILQEYQQPTDTLYIKAAPSLQDRAVINSLLTNTTLIPDDDIYRLTDVNFGKASSVIYEHAYGIFASNVTEYLAAVTKNHYWRNITLGELKTAVARNEAGEIVYEVVYSEVIDNLINPSGTSINSSIYWPRPIDLGLGPWYTSITNIYTSYVFEIDAAPTYYTSLTSGSARSLYPNSLVNMRNRVSEIVGQEYDSRLLPQWMISQQANGSTLGYVQAWVICYTKPGKSAVIKTNIETLWPNTLNQINFEIDRFSVNKSVTFNYDNSVSPPAWTALPSASPTPNPLNGQDFHVLFPRRTILPDESQY